MQKLLVLVLVALVASANASKDGWDAETVQEYYRMGDQAGEEFDPESAFAANFARNKFACTIASTKSNERPTSVHQLKPSDIEVVAAVGDSLTAANGAKARTVIGVLTEDRGVSWSIGGENGDINKLVTLPNILKQFNPNLVGFSSGSGKVENNKITGFNEAHPGDTSFEMLGQAKRLVDRIRSSANVDFANSWKLITFFVGGNDLCRVCKNSTVSAQSYIDNVRDALDYFHQNLPRTLINLVLTLDVSGVEPLDGFTCRALQKRLCGCGLDKDYRPTLKQVTRGMQEGTQALVDSGRYDTTDQFTVVTQPFMTEMTPPTKSNGKADFSYFAPDCFHFSAKGHAAAAVELWKSMITPVGQKDTRWTNLQQAIPCPSSPFIYTNKNSNTLRNILLKK